MKIVQAANDNLAELMSFYRVMCDVLGEKSSTCAVGFFS